MGANIGHESRFGKRKKRRAVFQDINITPLVDVMLVLLVIFMVTTPMMQSGIDVSLPKTKSALMLSESEPLIIDIKADETLFLKGNKMTDLDVLLLDLDSYDTDQSIHVRADQSLDYGVVMGLIGQIHAKGFKKISLLSSKN